MFFQNGFMTTRNPFIFKENILNFNSFSSILRGLPYLSLPGLKSQLKMAPANRLQEIMSLGQGKNAVKSAVLFLFYPDKKGNTTTVFIKRPENNGVHGGQISFPGGRYEEADKNLRNTALRETFEEIGVPAADIEITGKLTDLFIPPSNFMVSPYIGLLKKKPSFVAQPAEVESLIEIGLAGFLNPQNVHSRTIALNGGQRLDTPCYVINGHVIWGATAMMVSEFFEFLKSHYKGFPLF